MQMDQMCAYAHKGIDINAHKGRAHRTTKRYGKNSLDLGGGSIRWRGLSVCSEILKHLT